MAIDLIDSGKAMGKLEAFRTATQSFILKGDEDKRVC